MSGKRETRWLSETNLGGKPGRLRIFWALLVVLVAIDCSLTWPLSENLHLAARGGRSAYHLSAKVLHSHELASVQRFYGRIGSWRGSLAQPHGHVASGPSTWAQISHILPPAPIPTFTGFAAIATPDTATLKSQDPALFVPLHDRATCNQGSSLNIVAHEDDDLLFMNPDIQNDILGGRCVRTVYLTAGDAGQLPDYWKGREAGAKAAYAAMLNIDNKWHDVHQNLAGKPVTVSYLQDVPQVSLVFLRLPDGNFRGHGFASDKQESLPQLLDGHIQKMHALEGPASYTKDQIVSALLQVMQADDPQVIRTQNPQGDTKGDHADHSAAAQFAGMAAQKFAGPYVLIQYAGYPDRLQEANLTPEQAADKQRVFFAYAAHDTAVCQTAEACAETATYGNYLTRQYQVDEVPGGL